MADPSLLRFRTVVEGALGELEARRQEVNDLNVFPVADGDTGDNMALTLRAVLDELDRLSEYEGAARRDRPRARSSTRWRAPRCWAPAATPGVILSQLIRGAAEELISRPGELVDPVLIGAAMARAADRAYGSVRAAGRGHDPHRGARDGAPDRDRARAHAAAAADGGLGPRRAGRAAGRCCSSSAIDAGEESVKRGPELLPVLREAGVVDAGGYGLT